MKKQMKKAVYEAPVTEHFQIELEGSFCGSVNLENKEDNSITIEDQEINTGFEEAFGNGSADNWD